MSLENAEQSVNATPCGHCEPFTGRCPVCGGDSPKLRPLTPTEIADEAICLFLEYRDSYGYDEDQAKAKTILEVSEGLEGCRT